MRVALLLAAAAAVALMLVACGESDTRTITKTVQAGATTPTTDMSGVTGEDTSTVQECDAQGINAEIGNEGRCEKDGRAIVVVNRASALRLRTLAVWLKDVATTASITSSDIGRTDTADGVFVVFRLVVRNRGDAPMAFTTGTGSQVALQIGKKMYSDDFDVQNGYATDSFMWQGKAIQPGASQTGTVVFDIPRAAAARLDARGGLIVLNSDETFDYPDDLSEIGIVRLWQ